MSAQRLEVWGDPISHSSSPALHAAAYRVLGLDWEYGRRQVSTAGFEAALAATDATWRGLSLTMPLKEVAFRAAGTRDAHAELTGAVNTLLLGTRRVGFNTDVGGIVDALNEAGIAQVRSVRVLGAGATAASALVAVHALGAKRVEVRARRPERAAGMAHLAGHLGIRLTAGLLDAPADGVDLTIATLPGGAVLDTATASSLSSNGGALFEAAYAPWPSALAAVWGTTPVISGLRMLLHQAVRQVRIFHHGDPAVELPHEDRVREAMNAAI